MYAVHTDQAIMPYARTQMDTICPNELGWCTIALRTLAKQFPIHGENIMWHWYGKLPETLPETSSPAISGSQRMIYMQKLLQLSRLQLLKLCLHSGSVTVRHRKSCACLKNQLFCSDLSGCDDECQNSDHDRPEDTDKALQGK